MLAQCTRYEMAQRKQSSQHERSEIKGITLQCRMANTMVNGLYIARFLPDESTVTDPDTPPDQNQTASEAVRSPAPRGDGLMVVVACWTEHSCGGVSAVRRPPLNAPTPRMAFVVASAAKKRRVAACLARAMDMTRQDASESRCVWLDAGAVQCVPDRSAISSSSPIMNE